MPSSAMLRRVALVRTDVSEDLSASFIRVTGIGGTTLAVTSNRRTLRRYTNYFDASLFFHSLLFCLFSILLCFCFAFSPLSFVMSI
jgi:hypothetical protein